MTMHLSQRAALIVFIITLLFLLAQAAWWFIFMEQLVQERISLAEHLGASGEIIENIGNEEKSRQRMITMEGSFFVLVLMGGLALVYRAFLQQRQLRLQQENFIMAVTHELKTPLASMNVYLDGLLSPDISDQVKQTLIPKIKNDVYRLQKQIEHVLEAARTQHPASRAEFEKINFSELVSERLNAISKFTFDNHYKFRSEIEREIMLNGDRRNLGKAIDAILENSIIHNKGRELEIAVELKIIDGVITLKISDNGQGIPKDELAHIFDKFYRVGSELTRSAKGTGLGLYICREIVKAHGGGVCAVSDGISPGVTFIMKFSQEKI